MSGSPQSRDVRSGQAGNAADALCQAEADVSTSDGSKLQGRTWVAWLSTDSESAASRVDDAASRLPTGVVLASSKANLLDGTNSGNNCGNWTSNLATTTIGGTQYSSALWTNVVAGASCGNARRVYCFEQ